MAERRPVQHVQHAQAPAPQAKQRRPEAQVATADSEGPMGLMSLQGVDKNMIAIVAVAGVSIGLSFYLFREVKKLREDVKAVKAVETPDDLLEKVDMNTQSVRSIETKLDQLISALASQEQRRAQNSQQQAAMAAQQAQAEQAAMAQAQAEQAAMAQAAAQQMAQQVPQQMAQQVPQQPPPVVPPQEVQVPMMGGAVIPQGDPSAAQGQPTIQIEGDGDFSGPGVIKI